MEEGGGRRRRRREEGINIGVKDFAYSRTR